MLTSLPNLLTVSRILLIPLIVGMFWLEGEWARWVTLGLFIAAGVTDYLDGVAARQMGEISNLGRFLDPVADKLLVASILLMLVGFGDIRGVSILPALVILCREILVSGLREFLAGIKVGVPVSRLAKWKTAVQMTALGFLIVGGTGPTLMHGTVTFGTVGTVLLWVAALLTMITGYDYMRAGLRHMGAAEADKRVGANRRGMVSRP
ncbi:MAG TPA: CDP-diacylglycerol--glycerol-3-phosphate 3-phosphatidyltransferase [Alphaproteobacteria bacterium]|nr:CDP-diacylglycerol--glycerol-3-phosphate 3-phosphatidyltransferase [Alphaproteobacteria bacterium]